MVRARAAVAQRNRTVWQVVHNQLWTLRSGRSVETGRTAYGVAGRSGRQWTNWCCWLIIVHVVVDSDFRVSVVVVVLAIVVRVVIVVISLIVVVIIVKRSYVVVEVGQLRQWFETVAIRLMSGGELESGQLGVMIQSLLRRQCAQVVVLMMDAQRSKGQRLGMMYGGGCVVVEVRVVLVEWMLQMVMVMGMVGRQMWCIRCRHAGK